MRDEALDINMLSEVLTSLSNTQGVLGCLIIDREGNSVVSQLPSDINKSICESAVATLYGSSEQVIGWAHQGDLVSVIIEAESGNLLMSNVNEFNFIVIARKDVNLGLLRFSMKKMSESIVGIIAGKPVRVREPEMSAVGKSVLVELKPTVVKPEVKKRIKEVRSKMEEIPIPTLPKIPGKVNIPDDSAGRADLAFDIYKALFLSISIGASTVSGVAPTRGMLRRCLSQTEFGGFLKGVSIQKDATLDFRKLKENFEKLPPKKREHMIKENFGGIINSVVNGYGSMMGHEPIKGMTRKEIGRVLKGYKKAMKELGILDTIPPEIL